MFTIILIVNDERSNSMFIGREKELHSLKKHYDSDDFEFAIIY